MKKLLPIIIFSFLLLGACKKEEGPLQAEAGEEYSGGATTVFNSSRNAFGFQTSGLSSMDELAFFTGNSFFNQSWVSSPASTTARDGLGPLFNAVACSSCHFKDGRGRSPAFSGELGHGLLLRFSVPGASAGAENWPEPSYGGQLQDQGINNVAAEGKISISYDYIQGQYPDGSSYELRKPTYGVQDLAYGPLAADVEISPRVANQLVGMGLIEAIPQADILALEDPQDIDGNGVSGRANWIPSANGQLLGRYSWKANAATLREQITAAFQGDMGISSSLFPEQNCSPGQTDCQQAPNGNNAQGYELDDQTLDRVELYLQALAVPARRDWKDQRVLKGKKLFLEMGCGDCHRPSFETGVHVLAPLSNQKIYPYSDFLLHDMGAGLADNRPDYLANGQEWRTQPLWGLGLISTVNEHSELLHDGRARNIEEAILWHGGEAEEAKNAFMALSAEERSQVLEFLNSL